ncbi:hypothetical protein D9615_005930 [Tricholomella constricta]|uniref:Large ribosomal subunit protein bL33m n=1 Tax=Tricholomella constricta TaxID=117010 RepID=A0A8H5M3B5_9AGAR|nr:hypothetical protein D9615_005930 [Tricholomella constricta]
MSPMAAKAKARTLIVRLISTAQTGFFYTTQRLRQGPRLSAVKYDPKVSLSEGTSAVRREQEDEKMNRPWMSVVCPLECGELGSRDRKALHCHKLITTKTPFISGKGGKETKTNSKLTQAHFSRIDNDKRERSDPPNAFNSQQRTRRHSRMPPLKLTRPRPTNAASTGTTGARSRLFRSAAA